MGFPSQLGERATKPVCRAALPRSGSHPRPEHAPRTRLRKGRNGSRRPEDNRCVSPFIDLKVSWAAIHRSEGVLGERRPDFLASSHLRTKQFGEQRRRSVGSRLTGWRTSRPWCNFPTGKLASTKPLANLQAPFLPRLSASLHRCRRCQKKGGSPIPHAWIITVFDISWHGYH